MVSKVDHIGIAVSNLDEAVKLYQEVLGLELHGTEVVEEQKVKVAFLPLSSSSASKIGISLWMISKTFFLITFFTVFAPPFILKSRAALLGIS